MRITQSLIERSISQNLTASVSRRAEAQRMDTTGIRVEMPSDDPVAALQAACAAASRFLETGLTNFIR